MRQPRSPRRSVWWYSPARRTRGMITSSCRCRSCCPSSVCHVCVVRACHSPLCYVQTLVPVARTILTEVAGWRGPVIIRKARWCITMYGIGSRAPALPTAPPAPLTDTPLTLSQLTVGRSVSSVTVLLASSGRSPLRTSPPENYKQAFPTRPARERPRLGQGRLAVILFEHLRVFYTVHVVMY